MDGDACATNLGQTLLPRNKCVSRIYSWQGTEKQLKSKEISWFLTLRVRALAQLDPEVRDYCGSLFFLCLCLCPSLPHALLSGLDPILHTAPSTGLAQEPAPDTLGWLSELSCPRKRERKERGSLGSLISDL